jgi:L-threonylcarbamoyladenylate synthase
MNKTFHTIVPATEKAIEQAAGLLAEGRLVAFPTETVYGLGADATNDTAVAAVFEAKGRPQFNPLIIHVTDADMAARYVRVPAMAGHLMDAFWPGGLSLVMPRLEPCPVSLLAGAGLDTLAVRCPSHRVAQTLIAALGKPVAAPSANLSGAVSPTRASHVAQSLGDAVAMILDGGSSEAGIESTVIDVCGDQPVILRPGAITQEEIEAVIGTVMTVVDGNEGKRRSPGMLERHYAPNCPLRMNATAVQTGETLLGFGENAPPNSLNLSRTGNLREAAANLFAMLRDLETFQATAIAVMPIPESGLGRAINDRLRRAAVSSAPQDTTI